MTMASTFLRRRFAALPPPEERLFPVDAESKLLGHCHWQPGTRRDVPVLVMVHGLEGCSDSSYMLGIAEKAYRRGFHAVRLNQRNCGGTELLTPTLYNSGMSGDYRAVFHDLASGDGFEQIFFAGYSMGGNLVTKMAGEFGDDVPKALRGVCAVCPAIDLAASAAALEWRQNYFYQRHFAQRLMSHYQRKAELCAGRFPQDGFGPIHTVREFDDVITAPQFGYRDSAEYYEAASAKRVIGRVKVPMRIITAQDDPFIPYRALLAARVNQIPAIEFIAPEHGGHCAFISRHSGEERFWAEQRVVEFCEQQVQR